MRVEGRAKAVPSDLWSVRREGRRGICLNHRLNGLHGLWSVEKFYRTGISIAFAIHLLDLIVHSLNRS